MHTQSDFLTPIKALSFSMHSRRNYFFFLTEQRNSNWHKVNKTFPSRSLRSASERHLVVPSQRGSKSLSRTFSFTIPGWWNDLPTPIRNAGSLSIFKQQLKTHLFQHYFYIKIYILYSIFYFYTFSISSSFSLPSSHSLASLYLFDNG